MKRKSKVEIVVLKKFELYAVYINGTAHLLLKDLLSIQGWSEGGANFSIEFTHKNGIKTLATYNSFEKWKAVLDGFEKVFEDIYKGE